jgi:glycerophosphoryl diester phosphodiesterase
VAGWTLPDLAAFHAVAPRMPLAYLFETIGAPGYPAAAQLTAAGTHILYLDFRGVTAARVRRWHRNGLKVWVWTPSSRAQWQGMKADGVDAIATDWAQSYLAWAAPSRPCGAQY